MRRPTHVETYTTGHYGKRTRSLIPNRIVRTERLDTLYPSEHGPAAILRNGQWAGFAYVHDLIAPHVVGGYPAPRSVVLEGQTDFEPWTGPETDPAERGA